MAIALRVTGVTGQEQDNMCEISKQPKCPAELKRRDYLRKKSAANVLAWSIGCVTVCLALLATFIGIPLTFVAVVLFVRNGFPALSNFVIAGFVAVASLCGLATLSSRLYGALDQKSRFIPYVPPVRDQIAALPAGEVLLRGSDSPPSPQDELLRAAHISSEIGSDQLLRSIADKMP